MADDKIEMNDLTFKMANCPVCDKLSNTDRICAKCVQQYLPMLKTFMDAHPGATYMEVCWNKDLPIPKKALYHLEEAGLIKFRK